MRQDVFSDRGLMITFIEEAYLYRKNFSEEQRKQNRKYWEAEYRRIIAEGFIENPDANQPLCTKGKRGRKKKNKARNLLERMDIHQDKILAFLWHDQIPFSNNQAEHNVRMVKLKQKISGGFRKNSKRRSFLLEFALSFQLLAKITYMHGMLLEMLLTEIRAPDWA